MSEAELRRSRSELAVLRELLAVQERSVIEQAGRLEVALKESRQRAESLAESEVRLRAIVETANEPILTFDGEGKIESANPATQSMFGYAPAKLKGRAINALLPGADWAWASLLPTPDSPDEALVGPSQEVTAIRRDGSTFPAELSVSEMEISGERMFTAMVRDVSERRRIEELQSEFVSTVSHELRTPLTSIRGALGLLAGGVTGELPPEAREFVEIAASNCERLVRLVNDILDTEKMQQGQLEFTLRSTPLRQVLETTLRASEALALEEGVELLLVGEIPSGEVLVDVDRIGQVMANLLANGVKFSPPGARLEVSVELVSRRFRVSIRDHGPGIPEEFRERIFQRFSQADASTTREKGGTGLGLAISKLLIEHMRGRIGFEPAEGGGTFFFFELPYLPPVSESESEVEEGPLVLVCEDDPDLAHSLTGLLRSRGFAVHLAPTLERARRLLASHTYAAITLDLVLADGLGTELIHELRAVEATRLTPILVVTGSDRRLGSAAVLVTDVIQKPFEEERLLDSLHNAVALSGSLCPRLLHVEDDPDIRRIFRRTLPETWSVRGAETIAAAKSALGKEVFDVVVLDLSLPDGGGEELIDSVGEAQVILFSASDAPRETAERVSAAMVKSRADAGQVRDMIVSLIRNREGSLIRNRKGGKP